METQNPHEGAARLKTGLLTVLAATIGWCAFLSYQLDSGGPLVLAAGLAGCFKWLLSKPWGKDLTWFDEQWVDTDPMAVRAGALAPYAAPLMESRRSVKVGVCVAGALLALAIAYESGRLWWLYMLEQPRFDELVIVVLLVGFLCMAAYFSVSIYTRRVQFDDAGLCDANFFRSQRVPWNAVLGLMSPDAIAKRNSDRDQADSSDSHIIPSIRRRGANDDSLDEQCWVLIPQKGDRILRLRYNMVPQESLAALLKRIELRISARGEGRL